jgi:SPP1 family predicted phage head-tail adaptor
VIIGQKNKRISILRQDDVTDSWGDASKNSVNIGDVWASIQPLEGEEFFGVNQVESKITHRIRFRWQAELAAITPKHRISLGARTFDIVSVANLHERDREIECMVNEWPGSN